MFRLGAILLGVFIAAGTVDAADRVERKTEPVPVPVEAGSILTSSSSSAVAARETAGPDTFVLYGGPEHPTEGKFQLADGVTPDWGDGSGLPGGYGGGPEAWTPVDLTKEPIYWNVDTFNAENLNSNGPGNHALWCGFDVDNSWTDEWHHVPGYGNRWDAVLYFESAPLADPSVGQTVDLDFFFNYDTEPGYDFFEVQYYLRNSFGSGWITVLSVEGSNKDVAGNFAAPGVQFSTVQTAPIVYEGNDYWGNHGDQIVIRLRFESDGAWSDEDGAYVTTGGAVQLDDISLSHTGYSSFEDFEGAGPFEWVQEQLPFFGDFADLYAGMTDLDPCRSNTTPVAAFVDRGQIIRNGPGTDGMTHTPGGLTWPWIEYGVPGYYVVNNIGGLGFVYGARSEIWSPDILWDLSGEGDDGSATAGVVVSWTAWMDLPSENHIYHLWRVRSAVAGQPYGPWRSHGLVYWVNTPAWGDMKMDVTDLVVTDPERLQIALGIIDYDYVLQDLGHSTPAPWFDNVTVKKYRIGGPAITMEEQHLAQDGFPISGSIDASTEAARDALDVPFSMAQDTNGSGDANVAGDSIVCTVLSKLPGASITDVRLFWALDTSPVFEDEIRAAPARAKDMNVVAGPAGTVWTGEVAADSCVASDGSRVEGMFFFDLPDADFMYPGDVLRYYLKATDSDGRVSTLPVDTSEFLNFPDRVPDDQYDRNFIVRALPTLDGAGDEPVRTLVINAADRDVEETAFVRSLGRLYYFEGHLYDSYTVQAPWLLVSNGIGSAGVHGATPAQLAQYEHIFVFTRNRHSYLLSDGSDDSRNDKGDDLGVLQSWVGLGGTRNLALIGEKIASGVSAQSSSGAQFVAFTMAVDIGGGDVSDVIGGQRTPLVVPHAGGSHAGVFVTSFTVDGACPLLRTFDQIQPAAGAEAGHLYTDLSGVPIPPQADPALSGVASVIRPAPNGWIVTLPFSLAVMPGSPTTMDARDYLLHEIRQLFGMPSPSPTQVRDTPVVRPVELSVRPNPFNPSTLVKFTAAPGSKGTVKVYNLRGELVRTLHSGEFQAQEFTWDGTDSRGASVASGVYMIRATEGTVTKTEKVALVK